MNQTVKETRMSHQERSDLSDKRMLDAAVSLILEKGIEKTTLKEVGEKAGYSRGLAGYRFGSKSGLFLFVLRSLGDYWLRDLTKVTQGKVGLDAILAATEKHFQLFSENPDNVKTFYILWFKVIDIDDDVKQTVNKINQRRHQDIIQWISNDPELSSKYADAESIADTYNAALNGLIYEWLLNPDDFKALRKSHDNLMHMIKLILK